jgi:hypothetical protein
MVGQERRSLRALFASNSSLVAAKVAERSAETGEHYITRTPAEYRSMVHKAAGGGLVIAFTTLIKFGLYALALSAFWAGFWAGVNYAVSFVLVQLLHFTVATKQPAMTAPAMAAKLKELGSGDAIESFVDEITHLVRSQVAAVLGNVLVVMPVVLGIALLMLHTLGTPPISEKQALHVLESLHLLGPSVFFAAFTGVLLFASSIIAGWTENWFVLARMDSAIQYNPRITRLLGTARAARWAHFLRENISGFAANISLGFMLGLVPVIATFFGLGLDVRHVTLSAGQIAASSGPSPPVPTHIKKPLTMGEFDLIARYFKRPARRAALGVGDDCALLQPTAGCQLAISSDMLVQGRHFFADVDPHTLGHKALAVNLSDLAACGAKPLAFTLALALPQADASWLAPFSQGLLALADAHDCELIGGDTTQGPLNICITVFGEVPVTAGQSLALLRSGALSKVYPMRSHTVAAEGGAAGVKRADDSLDYHFNDTVGGGDWLCEQDVVEYFVKQCTEELTQLEHWGCPWSRTPDGHVNVRAFGGMKIERTWFAADKTGFHMLHTLFQTSIKYPSIKRFRRAFLRRSAGRRRPRQGVVTIEMASGEFT